MKMEFYRYIAILDVNRIIITVEYTDFMKTVLNLVLNCISYESAKKA